MVDIFVYSFIILIFASVRIEKDKVARGFNYDKARALQGIAAMMVVLHHLSQNTISGVVFPMLKNAGIYAVAIFFMISGYGLTISTIENPIYMQGFLKEKVKKIVLPYLIMTLIYIGVYRLIGKNGGIHFWIQNMVNRGRPIIENSWYILVILLFYCIFFFIFHLRKKIGYIEVIFFTGVVGSYTLAIIYLTSWESYWYLSVFCFPLGMLLGVLSKRTKRVAYTNPILTIILSLFALVIGVILRLAFSEIHWFISIVLQIFIVVVSTWIIYIVVCGINFVNGFWQRFGRVSLELYLIHRLVYSVFRSDFVYLYSDFEYVYCSLVISFLFALVFKHILNSGRNKKIILAFGKKSSIVTLVSIILAVLVLSRFIVRQDNSILLNTNISTVTVTDECVNPKLTINVDANHDAKLIITNENIAPDKYIQNGVFTETSWFYLSDKYSTLTMYGGFNYAIWNFYLENGTIVTIDHSKNMYNNMKESTLDNECIDVVEIPQGAKCAKVTYLKRYYDYTQYLLELGKGIIKRDLVARFSSIYECEEYYEYLKKQELYIVYGEIPSCTAKHSCHYIQLPKISDEEYFEYSDNEWRIVKDENNCTIVDLEPIDIDKGMTLTLIGGNKSNINLCSDKLNTETDGKEYGVRWNRDEASFVCERIGDAVGLHTNYVIGDTFAGIYPNDFDKIYPWSDIKICWIKDDIVHYDMQNATGDIMVEIPKFYVKREIIDNWEYIWISKTEHEGYQIEPAFQKGDSIVDKIYVGAYLSSISAGSIMSQSGAVPLIDLSISDIRNYLVTKGLYWNELDIQVLNCIQRLFLVETGVRNSQSLFKGYTRANFIWSNDSDPKYAKNTDVNTNQIVITRTEYTERFKIGDCVAIVNFEHVNELSAYETFTREYKNESKDWQRKIVNIETVGKTLVITFSGSPVNVTCGETIITNLPQINGMTDIISYPTGTLEGGAVSFKYRYIENLWGNVSVIIDGMYVENDHYYTENTDNRWEEYGLKVPNQSSLNSSVPGYECAIKNMGLVKDSPLLMLPTELGDGANLSNAFGDWFSYPYTDGKRYLTYGMTWDLQSYAGLFAYRILPDEGLKKVENGSRIYFRK